MKTGQAQREFLKNNKFFETLKTDAALFFSVVTQVLRQIPQLLIKTV
jgi:hypothetical protein